MKQHKETTTGVNVRAWKEIAKYIDSKQHKETTTLFLVSPASPPMLGCSGNNIKKLQLSVWFNGTSVIVRLCSETT
jgi:hypothetical protein